MTLLAIPPEICVTDATSWNVSPWNSTGSTGTAASAATPSAARVIAFSAAHGRAECPLRPRNVQTALMFPTQPACSSPSVGSIITTNSASTAERSSSGTSALSVDGSSSRGKNSAPYGAPPSTSSIITASAPFMSLAPKPCTRPPSSEPGMLSCAGTVSRCPASRTTGVVPGGRASTHESPNSSTSAPPERSTCATCAASVASSRDSLGTFTSSSVRSASRAATSVSLGAGRTGTGRDDSPRVEWDVLERSRNGRTSQSHATPPQPGRARQRAFAIAATPHDEDLAELGELLRTAGVAVVGEMVQKRDRPHPNTYLGPGKVDELVPLLKEADANVVVTDDELSPRQQRNLEEKVGMPVLDRTAVILDIFAGHANTAEGKLQVELAQLEYNMARMRGLWTHLERLGGGIGTRGPGESQIETDRRLARDRIAALKRRLRDVERSRGVMRAGRQSSPLPQVALAGYTNAGKSTLLNAMTGADVGVGSRLFHTLDPTTRSFEHAGREYLVTDTVGFIRKLPHQLVEAFKATLEETTLADLILHVVDASEPEEQRRETMAAVASVLEEIGARGQPRLLVLNKADLLDDDARGELRVLNPGAVVISAATGNGLNELGDAIEAAFAATLADIDLLVPYTAGARLAELHELAGEIEREDRPEGVVVPARVPAGLAHRFAEFSLNGTRNGNER